MEALLHARRTGTKADDVTLRDGLADEADAYAVQEQVVRSLGSAGAVARHWKSGAPSQAEPVKHAALPPAGVLASGDALAVDGGCLVEAEIALRIGMPVGPREASDLAPGQAALLVDGMAVAIEVLASRWAGGRGAAPLLRLADGLSHRALVLGRFVPFEARAWRLQACDVRIGNTPPRPFRGSLGIQNPLWVLPAWLRHATRHGATVPEGTVVSTGSWCGLLAASPGELVTAEFPGIGSASVLLSA